MHLRSGDNPVMLTNYNQNHPPQSRKCRTAFTTPLSLRQRPTPSIQICNPLRNPRIPKCIVVLGGSSGVGLEATNYLKTKGVTVTSFSRSTGHDLSDPAVSNSVLRLAEDGLAISVGAGRRKSTREDELKLYATILTALQDASHVHFVVAVARNFIITDVRQMFADVTIPWVLLRPGPLVDEDSRKPEVIQQEDLLVTDDMRCNGLVSRRGVGAVVGDLLLRKVDVQEVSHRVLGVYDRNRMINFPNNVSLIGDHQWGSRERK